MLESGTSDFHGSVYEYLRNSFFNANTWSRNHSTQPALRNHPPAFRFNQFGWNLGGPILIPHIFNTSRQKLFFRLGQEYTRYRQAQTQTGVVPTSLMRQGDFSELLGPNMFYQRPVQITNPLTGLPFPGNIIPHTQLSPNGIGLLNAYPLPNTSSAGYDWQASAPAPVNQRKDTLVLDYAINDAHHLRLSILSYRFNNVVPFASNFLLLPQLGNLPDQIGVLHHTWVISPKMVNEATLSASVDHSTVTNNLSSGAYNWTNYGINYPYLFAGAEKLVPNKVPTINITNFTTLSGGPYPSHSGGVITNLADNLTRIAGNHTITVGGLWQRASENNFDQISIDAQTLGATNNQNGQSGFTNTRSNFPSAGIAVANTALGLFNPYREIGQKSYTVFQANFFELFAQDQWRATPNLVVQYGVRYSIFKPYSAKWGNQPVFDPSLYQPGLAPTVNPVTGTISGGDPYNGVVIPGSGFPSSARGHVPDAVIDGTYNRLFRGYSDGYSKTIFTDIQPRVGITYQVGRSTVVCAGGGRFVPRLGIADTVQLGGNAPFQPSVTVTGGSVDNP